MAMEAIIAIAVDVKHPSNRSAHVRRLATE
jgi:hypothetical protein